MLALLTARCAWRTMQAQVLRVLVLIDKTMQPLDLVLIDGAMPQPTVSCASPQKVQKPCTGGYMVAT